MNLISKQSIKLSCKFILFLFTAFFLIGCHLPDQLPYLIIFKEIGMPRDAIGIYEQKIKQKIKDDPKDITRESIYINYNESKYTLAICSITEKDKKLKNALFFQGTFVPSKVPGTNDYYIMSFPNLELGFVDYDENGSFGQNNPIFFKNTILGFKFENNKILIWYDLVSDKEEKNPSADFRKAIIESYSNTFIDKPDVILYKKENLSSSYVYKTSKMIEDFKKTINQNSKAVKSKSSSHH